jgi:hypothetical protein
MKLRVLALTFAFAALPAAGAQAADYSATLGGATLKYEWDGGPGVSVIGDSTLDVVADCGPGHDCDNLLVKTDEAGTLQVGIAGTSDGNLDTDIYLYESNASGEPGKLLGAGESFSPDDAVSTRSKAGAYYLAVISYRTALAATYKGTATLKPSAPPAAAVPPAADQPPSVALGKLATRKVRRFSGTAGDDKGVAKVDLALMKKSGRKCQALGSKGKFGKAGSCDALVWLTAKGTTKWSFTLRKALKKGSYIVAARAIDSAGASSQALSRAFRAR